MNKNKLSIISPIALICLVLLLSGCGSKVDKLPNDFSEKEAEELANVAAEAAAEQAIDEASKESDEVAEAEDDNCADVDEIDYESLIGTYVYKMGDDEEERNFEIFKIAGNYYIEYMGYYDYAGAELLINNAEAKSDCVSYEVTMYPFSGFSFMGDFWETGDDCSITVEKNGDVTIGDGQPFLDRRSLELIRKDDIFIHETSKDVQKNDSCKELIGTWRCMSERDGDSHEITMIFSEDGRYMAVNKVSEQTPMIYIGRYKADKEGGELEGTIECEAFAYGTMPYEWVLKYDDEQKCPVIYDDYTYAEPFTFLEDDKNLPFKKIEDSDESSIAPGPGSRASEINKMYEDASESEYLEDVIYYVKAYTKAPIVEVDSVTDGPSGKIVTVHCYEIVDDGDNSHTATWDWINYEVETGIYTDFFGNEIDMSKY